MTKEDEKAIQRAWGILAGDPPQPWRLEDSLRAARLRLITLERSATLLEQDIKIGEAVLAKLRKP